MINYQKFRLKRKLEIQTYTFSWASPKTAYESNIRLLDFVCRYLYLNSNAGGVRYCLRSWIESLDMAMVRSYSFSLLRCMLQTVWLREIESPLSQTLSCKKLQQGRIELTRKAPQNCAHEHFWLSFTYIYNLRW